MKKILLCASFIALLMNLSGCASDEEVNLLKAENRQLVKQIESVEKQVKSLQKEKSNSEAQTEVDAPPKISEKKPAETNVEEAPIKVASIEIGPDNAVAGIADLKVNLQNISEKTVDAIEFVVLQFDNFGRPSNRFNDPSHGNVTSTLMLQGNAKTGESLKGAWSIYNMENSTKAKVVLKQVHLADGSIWTNKRFDVNVQAEKGQY